MQMNKLDFHVIATIKKLREQLDDLLNQEEAYWAVRANQIWMCNGDRNTKYFHAVAAIKKQRK